MPNDLLPRRVDFVEGGWSLISRSVRASGTYQPPFFRPRNFPALLSLIDSIGHTHLGANDDAEAVGVGVVC